MNSLHYPDGEPCRVGDVVWLNGGLQLGRVAATGDDSLLIMRGLSGSLWGSCNGLPESTQRLTSTEWLAVELLFHLLGQQLGQPLWNAPEWSSTAQLVLQPAGNDPASVARVWELAFAPRNAPDEVQRFRFDRCNIRFLRPEKASTPMPPKAHEPGTRCVQADGVSYHEGDLLWEHSGVGMQVTRLHHIVHLEDEDWQWYYELEAETQEDDEPGIVLMGTGVDGRSGSCTYPLSYIDDEWCGKLSDTERLAVELLFHIVKQHPLSRMRGWDTCLDHLYLSAEPGQEYDRASYWEYQYTQWTLALSFCSPYDAHIHAFRSFRFNRASHDFTPIEDDAAMLHVTGGGIKPGFGEKLRRALLQLFRDKPLSQRAPHPAQAAAPWKASRQRKAHPGSGAGAGAPATPDRPLP